MADGRRLFVIGGRAVNFLVCVNFFFKGGALSTRQRKWIFVGD